MRSRSDVRAGALVLATGAVLALAVTAAAGRGGSSGHARAVVISSASVEQGAAEVSGPGRDSASATASGREVVASGQASASVTATRATASADAREVSAFGGLVTARAVSAEADGAGGTSGSVQGLVIAGRAVGTTSGGSYSMRYGSVAAVSGGAGLTVTLSRPYHGFATGSTVRVASVAATAPRAASPPAPTTTTPPPGTAPAPPTATRDTTRSSPGGHRGGSKHGTGRGRHRNLRRRRAPKHVVAPLTGSGYTFPVASPAAGAADNFGVPREIGAHQGDDIFAPFGAPVVAVHSGRISRVGTLPISGNRLWLTTPRGDAFFYAHLSAFSPAAVDGAEVRAGAVLGFVGNTGDAEPTPPHLHFEIHPGGEEKPAVDPYAVLRAWRGRHDADPRAWAADTTERPGTLVQIRDFLALR